MLIIIPNPNQMLQLVKAQKKIIQQNDTSLIFFQNSPLWIPVFADDLSSQKIWKKDELKQYSAQITSIRISAPTVRFDEERQQFAVSSEVFITHTQDGMRKSLINLCKSVISSENQNTTASILPSQEAIEAFQKKISSQETFPMSLKVFRVADSCRQGKNSFAVTDFVWKKIR